MKKFIFLFTFVVLFIGFAQKIQAATIIAVDADTLKSRYAGSIVVEDTGFAKQYWYVEPKSQERYLLKDGVSVSRLLKTFATGIKNNDLNKIATSTASVNVDYQLTAQMRGQLLLQVEEDGQAWYLNPLDNYRYKIDNGFKGLKTLKNLALEIKPGKLAVIPIVDNLNFEPLTNNNPNFPMYWEIQNILKDDYYKAEEVNNKQLFYGSLEGMVQSLGDPYTEFFSPQQKKEFDNQMQGSLEGIGAMVEQLNKTVVIISPLSGSPAEKVGLQPQDQILEANHIDLRGLTLDDSISLIKGPSGTEVLLKIYRPATQETFEVSIIREKINIPLVIGKKLDNNIAYFKISMFSLDLKASFEKIKNNTIDENTKGIIIDLRNNPGGYSSAAIDLADYWLPAGELILQEKYPDLLYQFSSRLDQEIKLPTVILVNNGTASSAEIFTSALSEHNLAKIVGQTTFGKGTGQTLLSFADGSALKYTVFEWLTPNGISLEENGITPDYLLENNSIQDQQLEKAKELLR